MGGDRGWWEAEGGLHLLLGHRQWCCVFSKGQKHGSVQSTILIPFMVCYNIYHVNAYGLNSVVFNVASI